MYTASRWFWKWTVVHGVSGHGSIFYPPHHYYHAVAFGVSSISILGTSGGDWSDHAVGDLIVT
jgi:hypothetical protein